MRLVTIETSTPLEDVAVVEDGRIIARERRTAGRGHAEELIGAVAAVLDRAGAALRDLDAIAVSIGPGRFTGLRVGLATAKGLSCASGVAVVPVETLRALARSAETTTGLVCPALDARRGEVYAALFRAGPTHERLLPDLAVAPGDLIRRVSDAASGSPVLFLGTGATAYASTLREGLGAAAVFPDADVVAPGPIALGAVAEDAPLLTGADVESLEPIYLRGIS